MTVWTGKHGWSAYNSGRCKCDVCRRDASKHANMGRSRRYRLTAEGKIPESVKHGRACYVNWGCRCDICYDAQSDYNHDYQPKETAT